MERTQTELLGPVFGIADSGSYTVPRAGAPTDLRLDGSEGCAPMIDAAGVLTGDATELLRRYPDAGPLERTLAERLGITSESVIATAGADDAILRLCTALLGPGRELVLPVPTFEMIERYAALRGCTIREVPWFEGSYPVEAVIEQVGPRTSLIAVVSPNNPTGAIASSADLRRLAEAAPQAVLMVDLAYVEFADEDLTATVLELPNAVVLRTLSKARGLAGLRVGYAAGPPRVIEWLRQAGNPYPVSSASLALTAATLAGGAAGLDRTIETVKRERERIAAVLESLGGWVPPSQANFVFARVANASWLRDALAGLGIAIRAFPGRRHLDDAVRITCPGDRHDLSRLVRALEIVGAPHTILFDLDGVLADVSRSYRAAIALTARSYGVEVSAREISALKREGEANDDWALTRELLSREGLTVPLAEVTERFEALYQGTAERPGLRASESLTVDRAFLERLRERHVLGIVTGRPRADALRFVEEQGVADLFDEVVCREDAPLKPSPGPLNLALERLGAQRAWYVGDTVDDVRAARAAGLLPLGVLAPGEEDEETTRQTLTAAGASRVLTHLTELEELIR